MVWLSWFSALPLQAESGCQQGGLHSCHQRVIQVVGRIQFCEAVALRSLSPCCLSAGSYHRLPAGSGSLLRLSKEAAVGGGLLIP